MSKARILLVEDSEAQAGITKEALQRSGYIGNTTIPFPVFS